MYRTREGFWNPYRIELIQDNEPFKSTLLPTFRGSTAKLMASGCLRTQVALDIFGSQVCESRVRV